MEKPRPPSPAAKTTAIFPSLLPSILASLWYCITTTLQICAQDNGKQLIMSDVNTVFQRSASGSNPTPNAASTKARGRRQEASHHKPPSASPLTAPVRPRNIMDGATADATCRKLVAVLAMDAGFEGITASALDALTNAFEAYTQQLYSTMHSFSELAGRTHPSMYDLLQAFSEMNVNPASLASYVRTASHSKIPLLRGPLQETIAKAQRKKEKKVALLDSDIEDNSDSDDEEPTPSTTAPGAKITARTIVFVKRPTDPQKIRELNAEQSRLVESNLKRLMAAENKVAMAAAHKDGSATGVATDMLMIKEEQESAESIDRRALAKLEALPIVNYEFSKRQQLLSATNREDSRRRHLRPQQYELQSGHVRTESLNSNLNGVGMTAKADWRKDRRRLRKEQQSAMEELEQNLHHKRLREDKPYTAQQKLVTMDVDPQRYQ
ncbi:transcription initiation factor TFIID subunit 8 [Dissophora globulifera]|nr:transcription initiation factor TFIID subunit 8 [Dissophora globulifera]